MIVDKFLDSVFKHAISMFIPDEVKLVVGRSYKKITTSFSKGSYNYTRNYNNASVVLNDYNCDFDYCVVLTTYEELIYSDSNIDTFNKTFDNHRFNGNCSVQSVDYEKLTFICRYYANKYRFRLAAIIEVVE